MPKLWAKGQKTHSLIEDFTAGDDPHLDYRLLPADVLGSLAHALTLKKAGLITAMQMVQLKKSLLAILNEHQQGQFTISTSDEDGHTAIENRLVQLCGDSGKRIHLGRSRNDQSMLALRLWMRQHLFRHIHEGCTLVESLLDFAREHRNVPMAGRTHMQPAMPSSVGLWAGGFAEQILDDLQASANLFPRVDQCPLGSAAGYGSPLNLDRFYSARILGFSRVQMNMVYCGLSRGKVESRLADNADHIGTSLSKLSQDLILFSMPEFDWFRLPAELCTGSSIMPQKKNPDALELMRAKAASISARAVEIKGIIRCLPSGYNRDFQQTKGPVISAADLVLSMIAVMRLCINNLKPNPQKLLAAFSPDVFATDAAIDLVASGLSFREAYREIAGRLSGKDFTDSESLDPVKAINNRKSPGSAGNLQISATNDALHRLKQLNTEREKKVNACLGELIDHYREIRALLC